MTGQYPYIPRGDTVVPSTSCLIQDSLDINIYRRYTGDIQEIYRRYTEDKQEIYSRYTADIQQIYSR